MEYEVTIRMRITAPNDTQACVIADEMAEAVELAWARDETREYRTADVKCNELAGKSRIANLDEFVEKAVWRGDHWEYPEE